uniref:Phosphatidic acid phosphatase-related / PAP2-related n=1 Tax=Arundo donax TaxID=35708 RepID=A0A0A9DC24_ARUDO
MQSGSPTCSISSDFLPCCPCVIILKLEYIWNMRCILDVQPPPDCTLLNHWEVLNEHGIDDPVPDSTKHKAHNCSRENLRHGVVAQVHPGQHGEEGERPSHGGDHAARGRPAEREEPEVGGEEEHVLRVARGPPVGVAGLEQLAIRRAGLRDGVLDELVEDLRDEKPRGKADALELPAEEEVGDEAAQADEDRDEGDPREEEAQRVSRAVADVGERDGLQRRRHRCSHLLVIRRPGHRRALASRPASPEDRRRI